MKLGALRFCDAFCLQVARCHIKVELTNDSFTELRGEIAGPPDTPYEGGNYVLDIKIPETYPFNPPKVNITPSCYFFIQFTIIIQNIQLFSIGLETVCWFMYIYVSQG